MKSILPAIAATCLWPSAAQAGELFGGVYLHDVDSPLTKSGIEKGADVQLGYRWGKIRLLDNANQESQLKSLVRTLGPAGYVSIAAPMGKKDDLAVALIVDDVDQPGLEIRSGAGIEGPVDVDDHLAKGATERK